MFGGTGGDRTRDHWLKRPLLYRLSYSPKEPKRRTSTVLLLLLRGKYSSFSRFCKMFVLPFLYMMKTSLTTRIAADIRLLQEQKQALQGLASDILSKSKKAIFAVHRNDVNEAKVRLDEAAALVKQGQTLVKKSLRLAHEGSWRAALEEYTEAFLVLEYVTRGSLARVPDVAADPEIFLGALSDMAGELVRRAVMLASDGQWALIDPIYTDVRSAVEFLLEMDLTGSLRSKTDQAKQHLRKLEDIRYDISMRS